MIQQVRKKHVIFVGASISVRETLDEIATQRGVVMHASGSMQDCHGHLVHEKSTLLVMELNGRAAATLHSMAEVRHQHPQVPILAIVGRGDIPATVQAMRAGAANCLEKPVALESLVLAVDELLDRMEERSDGSAAPLTRMETTVLQYILQGRTNRQIAEAMHRSPRTIEVHRRHIMRKLDASTIVDLMRAASARGPGPMTDISTEESV